MKKILLIAISCIYMLFFAPKISAEINEVELLAQIEAIEERITLLQQALDLYKQIETTKIALMEAKMIEMEENIPIGTVEDIEEKYQQEGCEEKDRIIAEMFPVKMIGYRRTFREVSVSETAFDYLCVEENTECMNKKTNALLEYCLIEENNCKNNVRLIRSWLDSVNNINNFQNDKLKIATDRCEKGLSL